jgi:peptidyl-prolyl cis-trans isomerase A (cyclophilin A)
MKVKRTPQFLGIAAACLAGVAGFACAQQPAGQQIPDAPQATAEATTVPNGPYVVMDTSMGRIVCQFYQKQAPNAVANFIGLADGSKDWTDPTTKKVMHHKRYFDGTTFHRVIPEFMIQGGDPTGTGMGDPGYSFDDEFDPNLNFDRPGRLAMANSGPNTNGGQFFITEQAYDSLNQHYTLFGQCDDASLAVVKAIARVQRDSNDKPLTPVVLEKVSIVNAVPVAAEPPPPPPPPPGAASAAPTDEKIVNISAGVAVGNLIAKTQPIYPPDAKAQRVSGTVVLQAIIGRYGSVQQLTVVSGPQMLQQSALDAVKTWRYRPFLLNGEPVAVRTTVNIIFTLGD